VASELYKLAIRLTPRSGRDAVLGIKQIEVVQGQTSRHKRLGINADQKLIDAWLQQLPRLD
jgi:hypothetical protein